VSELKHNPMPAGPGCGQGEHVEGLLDGAIDESFPASDPPAVCLKDEPPAEPRLPGETLPGHPAKRLSSRKVRSLWRRVLPTALVVAAGTAVACLVTRRGRPTIPP
jgi:hypothetical protein